MRVSYTFLALACAAIGSDAASLRAASQSLESSLTLESSAEWTALYEAESEDRRFLFDQLDQTENQLVQLQQSVESALPAKEAPAVKKEAAAPAVKKEAAAPAVKKEAAAAVKLDVKAAPAVKKEAAPPAAKKHTKNVVAQALGASMKLKGAAALAPMLAMLKGMYEESKERIAQQNTREEKSKKWFAGKETEHKAKLSSIEGKFKNGTLSEEFRTNETRDETRYFTYWQRCRERQHRQFHTNLKIQHGMMMKSKKMIDVYEKALSGNASDNKQAAKQMATMTGVPEIVFLQDASHFCSDSLAEVRDERAQMQEWAHESEVAW